MLRSRHAVADLVHAPLNTIVLVPNATTGVNIVLRNLLYTPQDHILVFDTIYGACLKTVLSICETTSAQFTRIPISYPASDATVLSAFHAAAAAIRAAGDRAKIAIFDTVSSQPGARVPFEALTNACRALGILSCVDGAHGIGHLPLDLAALDPDFFVSNAHKWLLVPRPCAVFYVPFRNQGLIRTALPTSWGFVARGEEAGASWMRAAGKESQFETLFKYVGTMDWGPYLCVPKALEFREKLCGGEHEVMRWNSSLAAKGGARIAEVMGTEVMENEERTLMRGCAMVTVRLPLDAANLAGGLDGVTGWIQDMLVDRYKTFVPVLLHADRLWVRVSAQVYLDEDDFEYLGSALKTLCDEVEGRRLENRI